MAISSTQGASDVDVDEDYAPSEPGSRRDEPARRIRRVAVVRLSIALGLLLTVGFALLCGRLGHGIWASEKREQLREEMIRAARQGAVNLTTIDYEHAESDMKRILDSATGEFYDDFNTRSGPFVEVLKKAQSKTVGTVTEAGLQSINGDAAEILVAVTVRTTNRGVAEAKPRFWRMKMTVTKDKGQARVAKVDFVP